MSNFGMIFCIEGLQKNLSQPLQQPSSDTNQASPKYMSEVL